MAKLFNNDEPWGGAGEWDEGTRYKSEALASEAKAGVQHPDGDDPQECWGNVGRRLQYWKARAESSRVSDGNPRGEDP